MKIGGLSTDSAWSHALYPADPETGERSRRPSEVTIDDADSVDAFFARGT